MRSVKLELRRRTSCTIRWKEKMSSRRIEKEFRACERERERERTAGGRIREDLTTRGREQGGQGGWAWQHRARYHRQHRWNLVSDEKVVRLGQRAQGCERNRKKERERGERPNEAKARTRRKKRYIPVTRNLEIHPNTLACNARAFSQSPRFAMASALSPPFPIPSVTPSKTRGACSCLCWGCNNVLTYWST